MEVLNETLDGENDTERDDNVPHSRSVEDTHKGAVTAQYGVNAILIDFFLYDLMKTLEKEQRESIPHHRTRSIWY